VTVGRVARREPEVAEVAEVAEVVDVAVAQWHVAGMIVAAS